MNKRGKLIVFEGLDCSFKETNSNLLNEYIQKKGGKSVAIHFPRYGKKPSYFVESYLHGNYGGMDTMNSGTISMFYMLDMFDYMKKTGMKLLEQGTNIILDRYWYCNLYYRLGKAQLENNRPVTPEEYFNINKAVNDIADTLELPKPDLIIKMITDKDVMIDYVNHKHNKEADIHEDNNGYLKAVYDNYIDYSLSKFLEKQGTYTQIHVTDGKKIRSKEDIFNEVKTVWNRFNTTNQQQ